MRDGRDERFYPGAVCGGRNDYRALGAIIPILFTIFGYIFIYDKLGRVLFSEMFKMTPPHPFVLQLSLILLGSAWLSA